MSPRTLEQNQVNKKDKRTLILKTALKVFSDYGFHASSVSHIAQKANISKGLLYNYFENKEDLLKTIIFDFADPILEKYIEKDLTPSQIAKSKAELSTVEQIASLVNRNEYKRRQAAPGVRITRRAFGRDRRFPITSKYSENSQD